MVQNNAEIDELGAVNITATVGAKGGPNFHICDPAFYKTVMPSTIVLPACILICVSRGVMFFPSLTAGPASRTALFAPWQPWKMAKGTRGHQPPVIRTFHLI